MNNILTVEQATAEVASAKEALNAAEVYATKCLAHRNRTRYSDRPAMLIANDSLYLAEAEENTAREAYLNAVSRLHQAEYFANLAFLQG